MVANGQELRPAASIGKSGLADGDIVTAVTRHPRSYPLVRASFREIFVLFGRFSKFSDMFGPVRMRSDMFGSIRTHPDALRCIKRQSDIFGNFRFFFDFLDVLRCFSSVGDYF